MPVWSLVADICWFTERFSGHSYTPTNSDTPIVTVYTSRGRTGCRCVSFQPNDDDSQRSCRMVLEPLTPLCVEPFSTRPKLGKFVVIENNLVLGCGVVVSTKTVAPDHEREARSSEWHQLQYFPIWSARELFRTWFRTRKRLVKQGWLGWDGRSPYHPKAYHPKAPQNTFQRVASEHFRYRGWLNFHSLERRFLLFSSFPPQTPKTKDTTQFQHTPNPCALIESMGWYSKAR